MFLDRVPTFSSAETLRDVLDVRKKASEFNYTRSLPRRILEGHHPIQWLLRNGVYVAFTPLRLALIILQGLGQILMECPRHSLREQSRVVARICRSTITSALLAMGSCWNPFFFPWPHVRTVNIVDVRSASLYTQAPIPAAVVSGLFGWLPLAQIVEDVTLHKMSGLCWGKSLWLTAMFLYGEKSCPNTDQRLKALATLYESGSCPESALLQGIGARIWSSPTHLERLLQATTNLLKPITLQSIVRGSWRVLSGQSIDGDLRQEVQRCREASLLAISTLQEEARMGSILGLGVRAAHRFTPGREPEGWRSWFSSSPQTGFEGIGELPDGAYLITSEAIPAHIAGRHSVFYLRCESGKRGYILDSNVGLELLKGRNHWKRVADLAPRSGHSALTLVRVGKRGILDMGPLDLRRRLAEIWA